jgi:hypothetical protein
MLIHTCEQPKNNNIIIWLVACREVVYPLFATLLLLVLLSARKTCPSMLLADTVKCSSMGESRLYQNT